MSVDENKQMKSRIEVMNAKIANLERENTKLFKEVTDLRCIKPSSISSPRINSYSATDAALAHSHPDAYNPLRSAHNDIYSRQAVATSSGLAGVAS